MTPAIAYNFNDKDFLLGFGAYHDRFQALADKLKITYVNLYEDPSVDPFVNDSDTYFAEDKFHPSSAGYELWFKKIEKKL